MQTLYEHHKHTTSPHKTTQHKCISLGGLLPSPPLPSPSLPSTLHVIHVSLSPEHVQHEQCAQQTTEEEPREVAQNHRIPHAQHEESGEDVQSSCPEHAGEHEEKSVRCQLFRFVSKSLFFY